MMVFSSLDWVKQTYFSSSPEYLARTSLASNNGTGSSFDPPVISIKDIHAVVPKNLFRRSTAKGLYYFSRHLAIFVGLLWFAGKIPEVQNWWLKGALWIGYWFWQSIVLTGLWTLGERLLLPLVVLVAN